jgi:MoxR-like ATPase
MTKPKAKSLKDVSVLETHEPPAEDAKSLRDKVRAIRRALEGAMLEREDAIEALMLAFVTQEHVVFEGPPGTGKSYFIEALFSCMEKDTRYVRRLVHKFMTPTELVGGMDLKHFQAAGRVRTVIENGPADAEAVFLDEVFKANGACLNSLLSLLNERLFMDQDRGTIEVPLRMCAAASNEFPEDKGLAALYDRFLFRCQVSWLRPENRKRLLMQKAGQDKRAQAFQVPVRLTTAEWDQITSEVDEVVITEAVIDAIQTLEEKLSQTYGLSFSDRRFVQSLRAIKAAAWLDGETEADISHIEALRFVLWNSPEEREKVEDAIRAMDQGETKAIIDAIDDALRQYHSRPINQADQWDKIPTILSHIKAAGAQAKDAIRSGRLSRRNVDKLKRRGGELAEAHKALIEAMSGSMEM